MVLPRMNIIRSFVSYGSHSSLPFESLAFSSFWDSGHTFACFYHTLGYLSACIFFVSYFSVSPLQALLPVIASALSAVLDPFDNPSLDYSPTTYRIEF